MPFRRLRSAFLLMLLLTAALPLVIVESLSRVIRPEWAPAGGDRSFWIYDELLGWAHRANETRIFSKTDFSVMVSINSDGLRDKEYSFRRDHAMKRMLVLGDSFAWGYGVEHEELFTELLENSHSNWEIINAAVSGYGTDQEFLYLRHRGIEYRPDVVLLLFYSNDIDNNSSDVQYWHNKPVFRPIGKGFVLTNCPVPQPSLRQRLDRYFLLNTYFLARLYFKITRDLVGWKGTDGSGLPDPDEKHAVTEYLLMEMNELVRANGARLLVVSVPTEDPEIKAFLSSVLEKASIPYLPLDTAFKRARGPYTFAHDHHWNDEGHRVVARAIEEFLLSLGILP